MKRRRVKTAGTEWPSVSLDDWKARLRALRLALVTELVHLTPLLSAAPPRRDLPDSFGFAYATLCSEAMTALEGLRLSVEIRARRSVTSYYTIRRFLRFEAFKAELRSTVVATINQILLKAGAAVGFGAAVSLHHVPTLGDVQVSRADLAAGKLDFQEAMGQYSVYRRQPDAAAS